MHFQSPILLACLFLLLLDPVLSAAGEHPQVTFTTNATAVDPGQSFTAQCQVADYEVKGNEHLIFAFYRKNSTAIEGLIAYYYKVDGSGQRHWNIAYNGTNHPDLAIDLQPNTTYPACKVNIRPTKSANYEYYCAFTSDSLPLFNESNHKTVFVYPKLLLSLTSNVTELQVGEPFSLACFVDDFANVISGNYSVQFRYGSNTLLATYRVTAPTTSAQQEALVSFEETEQKNTTVSSGGYLTNFQYEIILSTQTASNQPYWCTLLDDTKQEEAEEYKSNLWPISSIAAKVSTHQNRIPIEQCFENIFLKPIPLFNNCVVIIARGNLPCHNTSMRQPYRGKFSLDFETCSLNLTSKKPATIY